jgi:hypothetical protein
MHLEHTQIPLVVMRYWPRGVPGEYLGVERGLARAMASVTVEGGVTRS